MEFAEFLLEVAASHWLGEDGASAGVDKLLNVLLEGISCDLQMMHVSL